MSEKQIENQIKKYLDSIGAYWFKHHATRYSKAGVPDIIALHKGRFIGIEVKTDTGVLSELQRRNIVKIATNGGIGIVARSVEEVKEVMENDQLISVSKGLYVLR